MKSSGDFKYLMNLYNLHVMCKSNFYNKLLTNLVSEKYYEQYTDGNIQNYISLVKYVIYNFLNFTPFMTPLSVNLLISLAQSFFM